MSQVPPPPPPAAPAPPPAGGGYGPPGGGAAAKSGMPKWVWALIGCGGLIFLLLIGSCLAIGYGAKKVGEKVQEVAENPMKAAELIVRANPEWELVESDEDAGTITVREKSSGKQSTLDFEDIKQGRFSFETEDGESTIDFSGADDEDGPVVTFEGPDGTTRLGGGGSLDDVPEWVILHPEGTESQSIMTSSGSKGFQGMLSQKLEAPRDDAIAWFEAALQDAGFEVETAKMDFGGQKVATVTAKQDGREIVISLQGDGQLQIGIQYDGK